MINDVDSNDRKIDIRVPQGFCLVQLLFQFYINDLPQVVLNSTVTVYAHDTSPSIHTKAAFPRGRFHLEPQLFGYG